MNQIRFHAKCTPEAIEWFTGILGIFKETYKDRGIEHNTEERIFEPGETVVVNWACAWNRPSDFGKQAIVICTNDKLCVLNIAGRGDKLEAPHCIYRCEDVILITLPVNQLV